MELMKPEFSSTFVKTAAILYKMDKLGFLDVIDGMLSDKQTISAVMQFLTGDGMLKLLENKDVLLKLLNTVADERSVNALGNALDLFSVMQHKGLIDPIMGIMNDDQSFTALMSLLTNDLTMNIIANFDTITKSLGSIDMSMIPKYADLIKGIEKTFTEQTVTPIGGLTGIYGATENPDAKKGMGILFAIIRSIGKNCMSDFKTEEKK